MNGIMVWAWMLWLSQISKHGAEWFERGCSGSRKSANMSGITVWAWMIWPSSALGPRTEFWFGHGCSGRRMLLEHERNYDLGMDALVIESSWNTSGIMIWAWMLWSSNALGTRTEL